MKTDAELMAAWIEQKDEKAFADLVTRHQGLVYRICLRMLRAPDQAEDASQATFVVLLKKAESVRHMADLSSWLYKTARNVALHTLRTNVNRSRREKEATMVAHTCRQDVTPEVGEAARAMLDEALAALSEAQRAAVILRHLKGYSSSQAATALGCTEMALRSRLSKGLAKVRRRLSGRGVTLVAGGLLALLDAEAKAAAPQTLLPSVLAVSKSLAVGSASGSGAVVLAEGAMKMMMWAKVKAVMMYAAAVFLVAAVPVITDGKASLSGASLEAGENAGAKPAPAKVRLKKLWEHSKEHYGIDDPKDRKWFDGHYTKSVLDEGRGVLYITHSSGDLLGIDRETGNVVTPELKRAPAGRIRPAQSAARFLPLPDGLVACNNLYWAVQVGDEIHDRGENQIAFFKPGATKPAWVRGTMANCYSMSAHGNQLAVVDEDNNLYLLALKTGKSLCQTINLSNSFPPAGPPTAPPGRFGYELGVGETRVTDGRLYIRYSGKRYEIMKEAEVPKGMHNSGWSNGMARVWRGKVCFVLCFDLIAITEKSKPKPLWVKRDPGAKQMAVFGNRGAAALQSLLKRWAVEPKATGEREFYDREQAGLVDGYLAACFKKSRIEVSPGRPRTTKDDGIRSLLHIRDAKTGQLLFTGKNAYMLPSAGTVLILSHGETIAGYKIVPLKPGEIPPGETFPGKAPDEFF